jgi:type 1 glutamine amidotransferase
MSQTHRAIARGLTIVCMGAWAAPLPAAETIDVGPAAAKIAAAAPKQATAKPTSPRRVLVFTEGPEGLVRKTQTTTYVAHASSGHCTRAFEAMGRKTGAYECTTTTDPATFDAGKLRAFDAIVLANVYLGGKLFHPSPKGKDDPRFVPRQRALIDFVKGGGGLAAIHVAAAEAIGWAEYNRMVGGTHRGHAWHAHQNVPIKLDSPDHPVNAAFGGKAFSIHDDVYEFAAPYSRDALRVLLSVDAGKAPASETAYRADGDYPVSWVKAYGKGRVFYTALGHSPETFANAAVLRHLLDGLQFALGDLKADVSPGPAAAANPAVAAAATKGWTALFNGKDFTGWKLAEKDKQHWVVRDGVMRFDGQGPDLWTREAFGDFAFKVDWRFPRQGDSGIYLRGQGKSQINIWTWAMGSGEVWGYRTDQRFTDKQRKSFTPRKNADKPVGEWNTFLITMKGDRLTVVVNGQKVISNAQLPGVPASGPIALQRHGDPIEFKGIYVRKPD